MTSLSTPVSLRGGLSASTGALALYRPHRQRDDRAKLEASRILDELETQLSKKLPPRDVGDDHSRQGPLDMSSLNPAAGASTILPAPATGRDASRGRLLADLSSAIDTSIAILGRSQTAPSSVSRRSPERPPAPLQREQSSPQPFRPAGVTQRLFETPSASAAARPAGSGRPGPLAAERPGPVPEPAPYSTTRLTADGFLVPSPRPPARGAYPAAAERSLLPSSPLRALSPGRNAPSSPNRPYPSVYSPTYHGSKSRRSPPPHSEPLSPDRYRQGGGASTRGEPHSPAPTRPTATATRPGAPAVLYSPGWQRGPFGTSSHPPASPPRLPELQKLLEPAYVRVSPDAWERFSSLPPGPSGLPSRFHATVREAQVACEDWQRQQRHAAESLAAHLHRRVDAAFGRVERVLEDLLAVDGGQPGLGMGTAFTRSVRSGEPPRLLSRSSLSEFSGVSALGHTRHGSAERPPRGAASAGVPPRHAGSGDGSGVAGRLDMSLDRRGRDMYRGARSVPGPARARGDGSRILARQDGSFSFL